MWIVTDVMEDCPDNAMIVLNENGQYLLFDTKEQATEWVENCGRWTWRVVEL